MCAANAAHFSATANHWHLNKLLFSVVFLSHVSCLMSQKNPAEWRDFLFAPFWFPTTCAFHYKEYRPSENIQDQEKLAAAIEKNLMKFAKEAGLDEDQLKQDMTSEVVEIELANVRDLANRFEITGTPFLIIGEEAFPGAIPADQINAALDK